MENEKEELPPEFPPLPPSTCCLFNLLETLNQGMMYTALNPIIISVGTPQATGGMNQKSLEAKALS